MNKALHVFVYLFLVLTGAALWFEFQLNDKRTEMKDRNRLQEEFIMDIARMTETGGDDDTQERKEILMDDSPVEAKIVDTPEMRDVLDEKGYAYYLEKLDHKFFAWGENERAQLREVYVLDSDGVPVMDGSDRQIRDSKEDVLLSRLKKAIDAQKDRLAKTREAITVLREQLESVVAEVNKVKPQAREALVELSEKDAKIAKLESEKAERENQIVKVKAQIEDLNAEITSLKDEVVTARDETDAVKEELGKERDLTTQLKTLVQELQKGISTGARAEGGSAVTTISAGDKGRIVQADNENMFAIVALSEDAMKELKGDDLARHMPPMEFGVKRASAKDPAGEFVGRIRIKQEIAGKNFVVCEIISSWRQDDLRPGDTIYAD